MLAEDAERRNVFKKKRGKLNISLVDLYFERIFSLRSFVIRGLSNNFFTISGIGASVEALKPRSSLYASRLNFTGIKEGLAQSN